MSIDTVRWAILFQTNMKYRNINSGFPGVNSILGPHVTANPIDGKKKTSANKNKRLKGKSLALGHLAKKTRGGSDSKYQDLIIYWG
jgi:hypothetical protein